MTHLGLLFVFSIFFLPLALLVFALAKRRNVSDPRVFLYAGLNARKAVYSTIGTIIGVGIIVSYLIGSSRFYGPAASISVFVFLVLIYPLALYFVMTSQSVQNFFRNTNTAVEHPRTLMAFIGSRSDEVFNKATSAILLSALFVYLVAENFAVLLALDFIYSPFFGSIVPVYLILATIVFLYVYVGGFPAVLDTDRVQFSVVMVLVLIGLVAIFDGWLSDVPGFQAHVESLGGFIGSLDRYSLRDLGDKAPRLGENGGALFFNMLTAFGLMVLAGFYMITSPDTWFRITHALYDRSDACSGSRREVPLAHKPQRRLLFVCMGLGFAPIVVLGIIIGSYGNSLPNLPFEGFGEGAVVNLGAIFTLGTIIDTFDVGPWFALALLVVFSLAFMSTIDTTLITAAQVHRDRFFHKDKRTNGLPLENTKKFIKRYFLISVAVPLISFVFFDDSLFISSSFVLGVFVVYFSANIFFVFMARVFRPHWRPKGWSAVATCYGLPFGLCVLFVLGLGWILGKYEVVPWNHLFTTTGPNAVIFLLVYGAVFFLWTRSFGDGSRHPVHGEAGADVTPRPEAAAGTSRLTTLEGETGASLI